jgi:hypothetical protein
VQCVCSFAVFVKGKQRIGVDVKDSSLKTLLFDFVPRKRLVKIGWKRFVVQVGFFFCN